MPDEEILVKRAQQRDPDAFSQLYEAYFDKIYRYTMLKIGDRVEAEDMTQQVFLKALQSISSYRWTGKPFSAWLFRIAHNLIVDHLRGKSKQTTVPIDDITPVADTSSLDPESAVEKKLTIENLALMAKELTSAQQEVIALRFTSQFSIAETAKAMGKSEGAIKALQHSAIAALRRKMLVAEQ